MKMTNKLKERFCKDMNIPIRIFEEPYFESRLKLYDKQFDTLSKYEMFKKLLDKFDNEQDYFTAYNELKDNIINFLAETEGMKRLKDEDMNKFKIKNEGFPKNDIYKQTFDGRVFISIDMKKANFTALRHYDSGIVGNQENYEDFIGMFTDEDYFKCSKYIRQVVFGNQNPKRQVAYEKHLMDSLLTELLVFTDNPKDIVFFSNDEIVVDLTDRTEVKRGLYSLAVHMLLRLQASKGVNLRQEMFELRHIPNSDGYVRKFLTFDGEVFKQDGYDFKCVDGLSMPFVLRAYAGEEVEEEDKVFIHEGKLAKLIEVPTIEVV